VSRWPRLMRRETLAEYLDVSTDKVDDLRRGGVIGYLPGDQLKRFDKEVIDKWLDASSGLSNAGGLSRIGRRLRDGQDAH
jgi:hypothetical protein